MPPAVTETDRGPDDTMRNKSYGRGEDAGEYWKGYTSENEEVGPKSNPFLYYVYNDEQPLLLNISPHSFSY